MITSLMGSVAATVVFNYFATKKLEELRWSVFFTAGSTGEVLKSFFIYVNLFSLFFVAALLVITYVIMMKKMNAPLFRLSKSLKPIGEGDFSSDITLRQKDEFRDVASALNVMLGKVRERFGEWKTEHGEISQALKALENAHSKGAETRKMADRIIDKVQKVQIKAE